MKKIKFRGKNVKGENIFVEFEKPLLFNGETVVDVAQFVGDDKNGEEIYSDDKVIGLRGVEIFVKDIPIKFAQIGGKFNDLILKK